MTVEAGIETFRTPSNPKWIEELSPDERAEFETVKAEDIDENAERMRGLLSERLGMDPSDEVLAQLATDIATRIRSAHDGGVQVGMDVMQPLLDRQKREAHRFGYAVANMQ